MSEIKKDDSEAPDNTEAPKSSKAPNNIGRAISKNAMILGVFALISTGLIAITHLLTKDKIALEVELSLIRQLSQMIPPDDYTNAVYRDCIVIKDPSYLGSNEPQKLYRMRNPDSDYAVLMTSIAPDGYSGKINLAIAISAQGKILGVNVLSHQETPGLGDKIERHKSNWLDQFDGLSINNPTEKNWKVKKDGGQFDALTGATITPRAVIKAVYNGLNFYAKNSQQVFNMPNNCKQ